MSLHVDYGEAPFLRKYLKICDYPNDTARLNGPAQPFPGIEGGEEEKNAS
ncbi:MAG: hypothetical protein KGJ57_14085 [Sphingomonadales bacterium]|nr:hypothetical protein [Sphingomonadales bacterium]MDE2170534.1 hypothetical protein [Sphingomonadales bacterium]